MKNQWMGWATVLLVVLGAGCPGGTAVTPTPDGARPDWMVPDGAPDTPPQLPDSVRPDLVRPDLAPPDRLLVIPDGLPSALQAVVNKITFPKNGQEYTHVYDSSAKPKNKLGDIIGTLALVGLSGFDFQASVDAQLASGGLLLLFDLRAKSIVADPAAVLRSFLGRDLDVPPNAADNFSGSESLGVSPSSPQNLTLIGGVTAGSLKAGPGTLVIGMPVGGTPVFFNLVRAELQADLSTSATSAMTNGRIFGLIPWADVDQKLIPAIAVNIDQTYKDPLTAANIRNILKTMFDTNPADGTISADEIRQSAILKLVLAADVDTDADGVNDALSVGVAFTAVGCSIK